MTSVRSISIVFLLIPLAACGDGGPDSAAIRQHISSHLMPGVQLQDFDYKLLSSKRREGAGRISAEGTLKLTEDRYALSDEVMKEDLRQRGLTTKEIRYYAQLLNCGTCAYTRVATAGETRHFRFRGSYDTTVDGFRIRGGVNHDIQGHTRNRINTAARPIRGMPSYEAAVTKIMSKRKQYSGLEGNTVSAVFAYFDDGQCWFIDTNYQYETTGNGVKAFTIKKKGPIKVYRPSDDYNFLAFQFSARIDWLKKYHWHNSNFMPGDHTSVVFGGRISGPDARHLGSKDFHTDLTLYLPKPRGGGLYTTKRGGFEFIDGKFIRISPFGKHWGRLECTNTDSYVQG